MTRFRIAMGSLLSHGAGQLLYRASALLLIATYAATLGPEKFGQLEKLLAISLLLAPLVSLQVYESFLFNFQADPVRSVSTAMAMLLASIGFVALIGLVATSTQSMEPGVALALTVHVTTTIAWQMLRNMLRVTERFRSMVACEALQSIVSLGAAFFLLFSGVGFLGALIAIAIGNVVACFAATFSMEISSLLRRSAVSQSSLTEILLLSRRMVPNVLLWWGIECSDRLLLAHFADEESVGLYSAGVRLAGVMMASSLLMYQSWQVFAIKVLSKKDRGRFFPETFEWYSLAVSLGASVLLVMAAPLSGLLFGADFSVSVKYTAILVPGFCLAAISYFFGVIYYSPEYAVSPWRASLAGFLTSASTNILLIPVIGALAAAWASLLAYAVILGFRYREAIGPLGVRIGWGNFGAPFLIVCLQGAGVFVGISPVVLAVGTIALLVYKAKDVVLLFASLKKVAGGGASD